MSAVYLAEHEVADPIDVGEALGPIAVDEVNDALWVAVLDTSDAQAG